MKRHVTLTVAAMILAAQLGSSLAAEGPSVRQLKEISDLLSSNDLTALRDYLELNPELLEGDSRIAVLLRRFREETDELPVYLGYDGDDINVVDELESLTLPEVIEQGSNPGDEGFDFDDGAFGADSIY